MAVEILIGFSLVVTSTDATNIRGAGSSLPDQVYQQWLANYKSHRHGFADVSTSYQAVGSGTGQTWFQEGMIPLEYVASDSLLNSQDHLDDPDLHMFPTMAR